MPTIVLIQPYIPEYRVRLFQELHTTLASNGHELCVLTGTATEMQKARRDSAVMLPFQRSTTHWDARVFGRDIRYRSVDSDLLRQSDLVIGEAAVFALENYLLAIQRRSRFALWGHGYRAIRHSGRLHGVAHRLLMRRAQQLFLYTEGGRNAALRIGIPAERITVFRNTTDVLGLQLLRRRIQKEEVARFCSEHSIDDGPVFLSIGGLDKAKRMDFLLESFGRVRQSAPHAQLVIAGDGVDRHQVQSGLGAHDRVRVIGRASERDKAVLSKLALAILNPGRVGLIATDSFAMEVPLITTEWLFHSVEFEYLRHGVNAIISPNSIEEFSAAIISVIDDDEFRLVLQNGCRASCEEFGVEKSADLISDGIETALRA